MGTDIHELLGDEAESLLGHEAKAFPRDQLVLPGPDFIDRVLVGSDRPIAVLRNLQATFSHGRLANTGYLSHPAGGSGDRALGGGQFLEEPHLLRPAEPRRAGDGGGVQRHRHHPRRARDRGAEVRPQDPA